MLPMKYFPARLKSKSPHNLNHDDDAMIKQELRFGFNKALRLRVSLGITTRLLVLSALPHHAEHFDFHYPLNSLAPLGTPRPAI